MIKKTTYTLVIFVLLLLTSNCSSDELQTKITKNLTKNQWKKPKIIQIPPSIGFISLNLCPEVHEFTKNKEYFFKRENCMPVIEFSATWHWIIPESKMLIDYGGILPNKFVEIIEVNDEILHTIEYQNEEDRADGDFWELKYESQ